MSRALRLALAGLSTAAVVLSGALFLAALRLGQLADRADRRPR